MPDKNLRRGMIFGSLAFLITLAVLPILVHTIRTGPDGSSAPLSTSESAVLWMVIVLVSVAFFQLGSGIDEDSSRR